MSNLEKVISFYGIELSSGNKIVCPFHADINPSMILNFTDDKFFCFGCGKSGNAQTFVKYYEQKLNDLQALKLYSKIIGSKNFQRELTEDDTKQPTLLLSSRNKVSSKYYLEAYDFYHCLSKVNWKKVHNQEAEHVREYMNLRGFDNETLNYAKAKVTYNNNYPIVFPILDNGKFKGWICRTTDKEVEKKRKYLYNKGFRRANTVVGNYNYDDYLFVVEGYMDMLKFYQYGIKNVVALFGWKITSEQIIKLKKQGITTLISALDNDAKGKEGTELLKKNFNVIRFSYLRRVKDPGEMDRDKFKKMLNKTLEALKIERSKD